MRVCMYVQGLRERVFIFVLSDYFLIGGKLIRALP
jgi:hypothetical protein